MGSRVSESFFADGVEVRLKGLRKTIRALEEAGAEAGDMKELMHSVGMIVVNAANPPTGPTGRLATTLRAGRGKTKAVIRAGGARARYAGVVHYGDPKTTRPPNLFLIRAIQSQQGRILTALTSGIDKIIKEKLS